MGIDPVSPIASGRFLAGLTHTGVGGRQVGSDRRHADAREQPRGGTADRRPGYLDLTQGVWPDPDRRVRFALYESYGEAAPFWFADPTAARAVSDALDHRSGGSGHRGRSTGDGDPVIDLAAATLGVRTDASQAEIDARFREIVKAERPDLGLMDATAFERVAHARRVLSDQARTAVGEPLRRPAPTSRWETATTSVRTSQGVLLDLTA